MSPPFLALSYFLHLVATVTWIGGLVLLVVLVNPAARRVLEESPTLYRFLREWRRRFAPITNLSLAVLVITGLFQMAGDEHYDGLMQFDNDWSWAILFKHIAVIGMVVIGLVLQYGVSPALERASLLTERGKGDPAEYARLHRRETRLTWLNVGLGILVLAFTAWATAI